MYIHGKYLMNAGRKKYGEKEWTKNSI